MTQDDTPEQERRKAAFYAITLIVLIVLIALAMDGRPVGAIVAAWLGA